MTTIKKAVIPVAGKGTRFLPVTKSVAKEMFPVVNIPALMLVLEECQKSGIEEVMIILSHEKENIRHFLSHDKALETHLKEHGKLDFLKRLNFLIDNLKIEFAYQRDDLIGSGGAVYVAKDWVKNQPFAVLFPDDLNYTEENKTPAIGQLMKAYEKYKSMVIGCKTISSEEIHKYGACKLKRQIDENLFEISGIVEKPAKGSEPSLIAGLARYIMPPETFVYLEKQIKTSKPGVEVGLTDTMEMICESHSAFALIMDSIRYDTGDKFGYLTAVVDYALRDPDLGEKFRDYLKGVKLK